MDKDRDNREWDPLAWEQFLQEERLTQEQAVLLREPGQKGLLRRLLEPVKVAALRDLQREVEPHKVYRSQGRVNGLEAVWNEYERVVEALDEGGYDEGT